MDYSPILFDYGVLKKLEIAILYNIAQVHQMVLENSPIRVLEITEAVNIREKEFVIYWIQIWTWEIFTENETSIHYFTRENLGTVETVDV